jgi:HEAT repeat protein
MLRKSLVRRCSIPTQVRAQALQTLKDTGSEVPVQALTRLVREDLSLDLRIQALELLVERAEQQAHEALRVALVDSEPTVHERASELIADACIVLDGD